MSKTKLRIATYNIAHGDTCGLDMSILAGDINAIGADIVGLQEVDVNTARVHGRDTLEELARASGYEYYRFCRSIDLTGGMYGTAILSKYPITYFEVIPHYINTELPDREQRTCSHAEIGLPTGSLSFFNTHLSCGPMEARAAQFKKLGELIGTHDRFILTGDFNTEDPCEYEGLGTVKRTNPGKHKSFELKYAIDDIIAPVSAEILSSALYTDTHNSDHYMLFADIEI